MDEPRQLVESIYETHGIVTLLMRDAIIFSGMAWESWNVFERFSVALSQLGVRVLYCENPVSRTKNAASPPDEIVPGVFRFRPRIWGHRLNTLSPLAAMQSRMVADQIEAQAKKLNLQKPLFIYGYMARLLPLCHQMQVRGHTLIHVSMDKPQNQLLEHASMASMTLVIPQASYDELHAKFGDRIVKLPQLGSMVRNNPEESPTLEDPAALRSVPHPRLIYIGAPQSRLTLSAIREILATHPQWHFVHFGTPDTVNLPNAHALPWMSKTDLANVIAAADVAFMPYDCANEQSFNCVPLKLLDHFAAGTPVVSTPIISVRELSDVVYLGESAAELTDAIESALSEPSDSPKRARRKDIARKHSLENIAEFLSKVLPLND
jgi:glycosyltransferase involved in cell wall biosynthesis